VSLGLLLVTTLAVAITGVMAWMAAQPSWAGFKTSLAGFAAAVLLALIFLGREFHLWWIDGELLDNLALGWIAVTAAIMAVTFWFVRQ